MKTYFKLTATRAQITAWVARAAEEMEIYRVRTVWGYLHELSNALTTHFIKKTVLANGVWAFGLNGQGKFVFNDLLDPADRERITAALPDADTVRRRLDARHKARPRWQTT